MRVKTFKQNGRTAAARGVQPGRQQYRSFSSKIEKHSCRLVRCAADSGNESDSTVIEYKASGELSANWKPVIKVAVTGAAGQICNHLLFMLAAGEVFGKDQPLQLNLLGSERSFEAIEGVAMELEDSLYPLLQQVTIGIDPEVVFEDADWALLVGAKPRGPGMERAELLDLNGQVFQTQGQALEKVGHSLFSHRRARTSGHARGVSAGVLFAFLCGAASWPAAASCPLLRCGVGLRHELHLPSLPLNNSLVRSAHV